MAVLGFTGTVVLMGDFEVLVDLGLLLDDEVGALALDIWDSDEDKLPATFVDKLVACAQGSSLFLVELVCVVWYVVGSKCAELPELVHVVLRVRYDVLFVDDRRIL